MSGKRTRSQVHPSLLVGSVPSSSSSASSSISPPSVSSSSLSGSTIGQSLSPSSSSDFGTSLPVEAANLLAESLFDSISKSARGSLEALDAILLNPPVFTNCSAKQAAILWRCTGISGNLTQLTRQQCLQLMEISARKLRMPTSPISSTSSVSSSGEVSITEVNDVGHIAASTTASTSSPLHPSSTVIGASQSGRHSSRHRHQTGQQRLQYENMMQRLSSGRVLSIEERRKLSAENSILYDEAIAAQHSALSKLQRSKRKRLSIPTIPLSTVPLSSPNPSASTSFSHLGIPSINLNLPSTSHPHHHHRRSVAHAENEAPRHKTPNSMDVTHSVLSASEDSPSISYSSDSSSSGSSADSSHSDSSSSGSDDHSSRRDGIHRRRRHHSHHHRHDYSSTSLPSSLRASRGLRRFLVQMGVTLNKARLLPEIERSMNGQSPIPWWRNVIRAANNQDSRAFNEGFNLAMCLETGKKVDYVREIIGRRLLGLKLVLSANERNKPEMWDKASAVLPLTSMTSISLPIQLMIDKQTRRSSRSTSFSASSTTSITPRNWRRQDGHRSPNQPAGDGNGGDGTHGGQRSQRYNRNKRFKSSRPGAPSASSNNGSSAGGSGANSK